MPTVLSLLAKLCHKLCSAEISRKKKVNPQRTHSKHWSAGYGNFDPTYKLVSPFNITDCMCTILHFQLLKIEIHNLWSLIHDVIHVHERVCIHTMYVYTCTRVITIIMKQVQHSIPTNQCPNVPVCDHSGVHKTKRPLQLLLPHCHASHRRAQPAITHTCTCRKRQTVQARTVHWYNVMYNTL